MLSIGVDPDTHRLAVACVRGPAPFSLAWVFQANTPAERTDDDAVVETVRQFARENLPWMIEAAEVVAIESQEIYPDTPLGKQGVDGLFRVGHTGGAVLGLLMRKNHSARFLLPVPSEWKQQKAKAAHHKRILEQLDDSSRATLAGLAAGAAGHIRDAICLAIWAQQAGGAAAVAKRDIALSARQRAKQIRAARRRA